YKALTCSASKAVSNPLGVLVIPDCITTFSAKIIKIDDSVGDYPTITREADYGITLNTSDGYGLILPDQSYAWGKELGENYITSGFCIRNSFCKGMLFTFDFVDFAERIAHSHTVIDAWGHPQDIRKVQVILTTSMLKLWDSYESMDHYLACCKENGYTFSITKMIPEHLENERNLNYQFIQSLVLSDTDIEQLIEPTVQDIRDIMGGDWRKSLLFLKGTHLHEQSFWSNENDFTKALMINKQMIHDPFVKNKIHTMIKKRMNDAKVGVLKVKGNFSIVSGDPYSLCQSMFGLKVTGLLESEHFYSNYWNTLAVDKVACFRAPMTCHNNIRLLQLSNTEQMQYWYKYMNTCTIFNSWDTTAHALNGLDHDSDSVLTTNNEAIMRSIEQLDAIVCVQKSAQTKIVEEADLIQANKNSFGDEIGATTNRITSMFDAMARFEKGSPEYEELSYRIMCGQHYQQNAIDKAKGIMCKSMPKEWYEYQANKDLEPRLKQFNLSLLADKKPYFFTHIYPGLKRSYNAYISSYEDYCGETFRSSIKDLLSKNNKTNEETQFLEDYYTHMPLSMSSSVMNKICWKLEDKFAVQKPGGSTAEFDYSILKTNKTYTAARYKELEQLYSDYVNEIQEFSQNRKKNRISDEDTQASRSVFKEMFKQKATDLCSNSEDLCNIVVDLCYRRNTSKQFVWDICGEQLILNLLKRNGNQVTYLYRDPHGTIEYSGEKFVEVTRVAEKETAYEYNFE
ncbi:MAG: hypothetical protein K0Q73_6213, partial [Paenibacillus sp.]|nr:hypothetical protein [Paenibacillus sp.]